jgi:hypothetical protein
MVLSGARRVYVDDVLETPDQTLWILGEVVGETAQQGPLLLFRGDVARPPQTLTRVVSRAWWEARLGSTRSGRVAVAWVERGRATAGKISLRLSWVDEQGHANSAKEIDAITLPPAYADLSVPTRANVVLQADGDLLAVAWRPLDSPKGPPADTRDAEHPPKAPFAGTMRIVIASPDAPPRLASQFPTTVQPLGGVTGHGPWGLNRGGAWSFTLDGRAVFIWLDSVEAIKTSLVAARPSDSQPMLLTGDAFDTLWVPLPQADGYSAKLYGYAWGSGLRALEVRCR